MSDVRETNIAPGWYMSGNGTAEIQGGESKPTKPVSQDYKIALPDGRSVVVNAPHEDAARNAAKNFLMREKGAQQGKAGGVDNFVRAMGQGASFGFGDEIAAFGDATFGPLVDKFTRSGTSDAPTWSERYGQNLASERAQDQTYDDTSPVWSTTGKIVGGVGGALATLPKWLLAAPTYARAGLGGALTGGVGGFGEGEGGFENRALSAGKGAGIGAVVGPLLLPIARGAGTLANSAVESKFGRNVADNIVGPGMRYVANMFDARTPRMQVPSLSAAAPEGGPGIPTGKMADIADAVRNAAPSGTNILDDAAARRIADSLQRGGGTVPGMGQTMDDLGHGAMPADANEMLARLGMTTFISPGKAPKIINDAMKARNSATGERIGATADEAMGDSGPAVIEAARLRGVRAGQGKADYAEAVGPDAPYNISPQMRQVMQEAPAVQAAMDAIMANAAERGVKLTPAQVAHRVKRQLALDADAAFASGKAVDKQDVASLAERWRTALHDANPKIKAADEAWAANTAKMDALDLGRQFMRQGTGEIDDAISAAVLAKRIPEMSAEEAQAFIAGAADTLKTKANTGLTQARGVAKALEENKNLRDKLTAMLGEDNARKLFNRAMSERKFAETDRVMRGGSDSALKFLSVMDQAAVGTIPTTPHSMLNRVLTKAAEAYNKGKAGNEDVRAQIAKMLTNTDAAANADLLDRIARQLAMRQRSRGVQRGIASTAGMTGAE